MNHCLWCVALAQFQASDVWLHEGEGVFEGTKDMKYQELNLGEIVNGGPAKLRATLDRLVPVSNAFAQDRMRSQKKGPKPGAIWWSHGGWMREDPYFSLTSECKTAHNSSFGAECFLIERPKNTLRIYNMLQLDTFTRRFKHACKQHEIDWPAVAEAGYWAIAVDFVTAERLRGYQYKQKGVPDKRYYWQVGWDVPSLAIIDIRAIDNQVYPVSIDTGESL